jgi:acetyl esterase/lipase
LAVNGDSLNYMMGLMRQVDHPKRKLQACQNIASTRMFFVLLMWACLLVEVATAQELQSAEPVVSGTETVLAHKDLSYVPNGHPLQKLDLYVPQRNEERLPLIVWIHGGGWKGGSKEECPPLLWSGKGFAVASINYRLSQHAKFPAQIKDCKAAIRWLRIQSKKYKIDPDRVVAWGGSAGGHLASLVGTAQDVPNWEQGSGIGSSQVQAVIDWYGRADLTPVSTDPALAESPSASLLGGCGREVDELSREASPLMHVSRDDPPFLIMHGELDNVVPVRQSRTFAEALKKAGVKVSLVILKGAGHGGPDFLRAEQMSVIDSFLSQHLHVRRTAESK